MVIEFGNLGPIREASFTINKPLTILCGMNSTGKTYVSYLLYSVFSADQPFTYYFDFSKGFQKPNEFILSREVLQDWLNAYAGSIKSDLGRIFGISSAQVQSILASFWVKFSLTDDDYDLVLRDSIKQESFFNHNRITISKRARSRILRFNVEKASAEAKELNNYNQLQSILLQIALRRSIFKTLRPFMFTAERNSIYTFKTELLLSRSEWLDQLVAPASDSKNPSGKNRYPIAITDSLKIASDLENIAKSKSPFSEYAERIEKDLLSGEVVNTDRGEIALRMGEKVLPIHMTSSIVKTLSSFVFYLKHQAATGDIVLIDEPEMNFHPYNQIILARVFARLSKMGIKFIISTHSDYIIRELNNLVMASELDGSDANFIKSVGYQPEAVISRNDLEVYNFVHEDDGVHVSPVEISRLGFPIDSIDTAIEDQNKITELLYGKLMEKRGWENE